MVSNGLKWSHMSQICLKWTHGNMSLCRTRWRSVDCFMIGMATQLIHVDAVQSYGSIRANNVSCFSRGSMLQTWVTSYALRSLPGPCAGRLSHDTAMMQCVTRWHGLQQERRAILSMIQHEGIWPEFSPGPFWGFRVAIALVGFVALAHGLPLFHLAALV